VFSDGYGECTVVGLLFGVMWYRVTSDYWRLWRVYCSGSVVWCYV